MKISLLSLPPELILEIGDFLPPDGILALKLAHRYFNETLPFLPRRKNTVFSDCAKLAIRYYLTPPNPEPSHLRCILCKEVYPIRQFRSSSSPACVSDTLEDASHGESCILHPAAGTNGPVPWATCACIVVLFRPGRDATANAAAVGFDQCEPIPDI
ncbi:hypothetical protein IQ06DRAFT_319082 [Phaeosphaeriaceae sp. SRC1lsM3a]|nr:hypothetical protein IQ06DRAFT_319082 [Stagonospora sp. SRC1lsM3a]